MSPIHLTQADESALYDQLLNGPAPDSDAAEPANLHEYPGDAAVADAERFARGCVAIVGDLTHRPPTHADDPVPSAFAALKAGMLADPDYAWSWHCNLAMPIMDSTGVTHEQANRAAAKLMRHLFDIDIEQHPHYLAFVPQWAAQATADTSNQNEALPAGVKRLAGALTVADEKSALRIREDA